MGKFCSIQFLCIDLYNMIQVHIQIIISRHKRTSIMFVKPGFHAVVSGAQPLKHQRTGLSITIFMSKSFDVLVAVHHLQPYGNQA